MYCCMLCRVCAIFPAYSFSWNVAQVTVMHMSQTSACGDADACMHVSIHLNFLDSLYSSIFRWSFYFVSIISILTWIWGASPLRPLELWSYSFRSCLWILTLWGHGCFKERGIDDSESWNLADRLDLCRIRTLLPCTKRYWLRTTRRLNSSARWGMAMSSHKSRRIQPAPCQSVRDLISKLLTTDPTRRYNVPDVRAHPWSGP